MQHVFWLEEGKIAGRTGPNNHSWNPHDFAESGFSSILSVNGGELCNISDIEDAGLSYACVPMSANAPPREGDKQICLSNLPKAYQFIEANIVNGPVLIHCRSGKDRAGLTMAYYLMREHGLAADEAMSQVLQVRPIAFTAEGWFDYCLEVLEAC